MSHGYVTFYKYDVVGKHDEQILMESIVQNVNASFDNLVKI